MIKILRQLGLLCLFCLLIACESTGPTKPDPSLANVKRDTRAAKINTQLGVQYLQRGDYEVALQKLKKAIAQDPRSATAHNALAILYQTLGEEEKATYYFQQAVNIDPNNSQALNNYAAFLCNQESYEKAESLFLKAIENPLYRSKPSAYENLGLCMSLASDNVKAEKYFRQALQLNPKMSKSLFQMAAISYSQADYTQARAYIQRYQEVAAWNPSSLLMAIKIENKLGDRNAMASYKLKLRSQYPDSNEWHQVSEGQLD